MKRKSYFSELREKQFLEGLRSKQGGGRGGEVGGSWSVLKRLTEEKRKEPSAASSGIGPLAGTSRGITTSASPLVRRTDDLDDSPDIWSFDLTSRMEINLAAATSTTSAENVAMGDAEAGNSAGSGGIQLDDELEELIRPRDRPCRLSKFIKADKQGESSSTSKNPLSRITNQFRRLDNSGGGARRGTGRRKVDAPKSVLKTPKKNVQGGEVVEEAGSVEVEDEVSKLESSIVVEASPIKPLIKRRKRRRRRTQQQRSPTVSSSPKITSVASQSQPSDHLASQISQIASSQSSLSSPVISRTPMSEWIHQDQTIPAVTLPTNTNNHTESIVTLDSPKTPRQSRIPRRLINSPPPPSTTNLLESFMAIKTRYDSSVRLFAHDLRNGKYSDATPLQLFIRHVADRQDKLVQALAFDLVENRDRWVLFKPTTSDQFEIHEGVAIKVYPPWREVDIDRTGETMIIDTHFYKAFGKREKNLVTDQRIHEIMERPIPTTCDIPVSEPLFMDLVPFHVKNGNTLEKQLKISGSSRMGLNVCLLQVWTSVSPAVCLVKDSDDWLSFLEVPQGEEILDTLAFSFSSSRGKWFKLSGIGVGEKVCISRKLAPFSVMYLFTGGSGGAVGVGGTRQTYFYTLKWIPGESTYCLSEDHSLGISGAEELDVEENLKSIDEVHAAEAYQDHRVSLRCRVKDLEQDGMLVTDDESDRSLRIEFVADPEYRMRRECLPEGGTTTLLLLRFLRVIYGKAIWDSFTTFQKIEENDEEDSVEEF